MKTFLFRCAGAGLLLALALVSLRAFAPRSRDEEPRRPAASAVMPVGPLPARALDADIERLRSRALLFPVEGLDPRDVQDTFSEGRAGHVHEALDVLAPRGTRVLTVDGGRIEKLFTSVRGGLTVYQFDLAEEYCYYYAHLDRYAEGLREGDLLHRGSLVGYVGTTGNAPRDTPHLHFAIFKLGPEKRWWEGTAVNPFGLWSRG